MSDLIKLVKTYRLTRGLAKRLELAERILPLIEPALRPFIFGRVRTSAAEDVLQEVLKAIFVNLGKFEGDSTGEFWAWCYRIARNKRNNQYEEDKKTSSRIEPLPDEELWQVAESSMKSSRLSAADRHDLDYAMKLLLRAKPECYDYLWNHYVFGLDYAEIAAGQDLSYDNVRMRIGRCLKKPNHWLPEYAKSK